MRRPVRSRPPRPFTMVAAATTPVSVSPLYARWVSGSTSIRCSGSAAGSVPMRSSTASMPWSSTAIA